MERVGGCYKAQTEINPCLFTDYFEKFVGMIIFDFYHVIEKTTNLY